MGEVSFHLIDTNGQFHVKTENERFTAGARVVIRTSNLNISHRPQFGRLRQRNVLKFVPHVQPDYFSSFNQSYH